MQSAGNISRVECYAATMRKQGVTGNEDAFLVGHGKIPYAALCDGAGNARQAAKRVLSLFEKLLKKTSAEQILIHATWGGWVRLLDSSLLGGTQSTFVGVAVVNVEAVGTCIGDSRAYLLTRDGDLRVLTDRATKFRLGTGKAEAFPIRLDLIVGEILLLLSDGAWMPLGLYPLKKAVEGAIGRHFSKVPQAILDAAGKTGRADDMTAVALRLAR